MVAMADHGGELPRLGRRLAGAVLPADLYVRSGSQRQHRRLRPGRAGRARRRAGRRARRLPARAPLCAGPGAPGRGPDRARRSTPADPGKHAAARRRHAAPIPRRRRCRCGCRKPCSTCTATGAGSTHRRCRWHGSPQPFFVAGVWRDYARQSGAIQMRLADYRALTGDRDRQRRRALAAPGARRRRRCRGALRAPAVRRRAAAGPARRNPRDQPEDLRPQLRRHLPAGSGRDRHRPVRRGRHLFGADAGARAGVRHAAPRRRHAAPGAAASSPSKAAR